MIFATFPTECTYFDRIPEQHYFCSNVSPTHSRVGFILSVKSPIYYIELNHYEDFLSLSTSYHI